MDTCLFCGRRIGLMKTGQFRKHNIRKGTICAGSWRSLNRQKAVRFEMAQDSMSKKRSRRPKTL